MATGIDISGLTLNPEEVQEFSQFIIEQVFNRPMLTALHGVNTGVQMKEQIVLASLLGKTGIAGDATCTRKSSGAQSVLSQKYWEPKGIEDTIVHCQKAMSSLFKAYQGKITEYKQNYEIEGSDMAAFLSMLLQESIDATIFRAAWFGDTAVAAAGALTAGLASAADVKFYDYVDGLWAQIFAAVTGSLTERITISENSVVTSKDAQLALASGAALGYFKAIKAKADSRLRANPNALLYVSREIFDNYTEYLTEKGVVYDINIMQNGLQSVKWDSYTVVNMETIWGLDAREDFVNNTTDDVYYLPHRIVFTTPENLPVATLNTNDFTELEAWYERKERENNIAFGFSLDAKLIEEKQIVVAY